MSQTPGPKIVGQMSSHTTRRQEEIGTGERPLHQNVTNPNFTKLIILNGCLFLLHKKIMKAQDKACAPATIATVAQDLSPERKQQTWKYTKPHLYLSRIRHHCVSIF